MHWASAVRMVGRGGSYPSHEFTFGEFFPKIFKNYLSDFQAGNILSLVLQYEIHR